MVDRVKKAPRRLLDCRLHIQKVLPPASDSLFRTTKNQQHHNKSSTMIERERERASDDSERNTAFVTQWCSSVVAHNETWFFLPGREQVGKRNLHPPRITILLSHEPNRSLDLFFFSSVIRVLRVVVSCEEQVMNLYLVTAESKQILQVKSSQVNQMQTPSFLRGATLCS